MLISGQSESKSAINKRIIRTGGVRVLGKAAPKPQIHIVQNANVTQQQKMPDTSSSDVNIDSAQVNEKSNQNITENSNQDINEKPNQDSENLHKENTEDLKKDSTKNETEKEINKEDKETKKEDSKVQRTAPPKKEPRRKRHHVLPEVKPVSKQPSASALSKASKPPAEKPVPVPRTAPTPKTETVSEVEEEEEHADNVNATAEADVHDEVCSTPPNDTVQSPDATQVS